METSRRRYMTRPDEPLLLASSAADHVGRYTQMVEEMGLPPEKILSTAVSSVPLPVRQGDQLDHRWPEVSPEAMWHPLLWLPHQLAGRYNATVDGENFRETDTLWAIRVALELTASGLYDIETGGWADVLASVGIDIDEESDLERVAAWQAGDADAGLDSIDLTEVFTPEPGVSQTWAMEDAIRLETLVVESSWVRMADDLVDLVHAADDSPTEDEDARRMVAMIAPDVFADVPFDVDDLCDPDASTAAVLAKLSEVANLYRPTLAELEQLVETSEQAGSTTS